MSKNILCAAAFATTILRSSVESFCAGNNGNGPIGGFVINVGDPFPDVKFEDLPADLRDNLKLPEIVPEKSDRTQNNNFTININGAKNDNAESLADKVMRGISSFGKTFLYDEVPGVL